MRRMFGLLASAEAEPESESEDAFSLFFSLSQSKKMLLYRNIENNAKASYPREMTEKNSIWFCVCIRARICKRLRSPGIDSNESIPPGWESIPELLKRFTNTSSE
jgi:hypothetical protein